VGNWGIGDLSGQAWVVESPIPQQKDEKLLFSAVVGAPKRWGAHGSNLKAQ